MSSEQVERGQRVECPFCNASAVRPPTPDNEAGLFWSLPPNSPMVDEAELLQQFLSQDDWHELEEPTLEALFQRMSSQLEASQQEVERLADVIDDLIIHSWDDGSTKRIPKVEWESAINREMDLLKETWERMTDAALEEQGAQDE